MSRKKYKTRKGTIRYRGEYTDWLDDYVMSDKRIPEEQQIEIYTKYKIKKFTFDEFKKYYQGNKENLALNWERQLKRQNAIESGQYEDIIAEKYRQSYLRALKSLGVSKDMIYRLKTLTTEEWLKLSSLRDGDKIPSPSKSRQGDYLLPSLTAFGTYKIKDVISDKDDAITTVEKEINNALTLSGLDLNIDVNTIWVKGTPGNIIGYKNDIIESYLNKEGSSPYERQARGAVRFSRKDLVFYEQKETANNIQRSANILFQALYDREKRGKLFSYTTTTPIPQPYIRGISKGVMEQYIKWRKNMK